MGALSLTKESKIYNGEKTVCLISGAEKTRYLHPITSWEIDGETVETV